MICLQKPFLPAFRSDITSSPRMSDIKEEGGGEVEGQRVSQRFLPNRLRPSPLLKQHFPSFYCSQVGSGGSADGGWAPLWGWRLTRWLCARLS